ncbi:hypothetical protein ACNTMW_01315 [Planosporangium sp. 12N6]|uniref:hypothetical protein n=1 Tax=Planosporangium spinosum TaxID=3402278 RepID=UPI003CF762F2
MRRATAALVGTVAGTVLLVGAKYGTAPASGAGVTATSGLAGPPASGAPDPAGNGGGAGAPAGGAAPAGSAAPAPAGTGSAAGAKAGAPAAGTTTAAGATGGRTTPAAPPAATCTTATGDPTAVSKPGVGAVTVTIKVCGGAVSTASGTLSQSNWSKNTSAIPALNTMAVQYYKTGLSQIHYSGASLTSAAYQASLKSAMTKAGI